MFSYRLRALAIFQILIVWGGLLLTSSCLGQTLFGITPFPYDLSQEALDTVQRTIAPATTMWAIHLDNGVPWKQLVAGEPLPASIRKEWQRMAAQIPPGRLVYIALAPLDTDRKTLNYQFDDRGKQAVPAELVKLSLDDPKICAAWLRYTNQVIAALHPAYLNLGIETGEVMTRDEAQWPHFVGLYKHVASAIRKEHPNIKIGISFGLGEFRIPRVAEQAKLILQDCDYVGLSFYPYASAFDEKFGAPSYAGATPWREPLAWIRKYTTKPIAICETGYTTLPVDLSAVGLHLPGDANTQEQYVRELIETAKRDRYLFVVWYLCIDYDRLYTKMPAGSDVMKLWKNIGLFDANLKPKPAWKAWMQGVNPQSARP